MKIKLYVRFILVSLLIALLLPITMLAALPPAMEVQWQNTQRVSCNIFVSGNLASASASITAYVGATVDAYARLYKIKDGIGTDIYYETTPDDNPYSFASFGCDFTPESGATYYLNLYGTVTLNGVSETIRDTDVVTIP